MLKKFNQSIIFYIFILIIAILGLCLFQVSGRVIKLKLEKASLEDEIKQAREEVKTKESEVDLLIHPKDGVEYHGWLSVKGSELLDQHGETIQLRGVSTHGIMWFPEFGNYGAVNATKEQGANMMRIAMYTTQHLGYDANPVESKRTLRTILENVLAADMYAIVDWHILFDQNPNLYVEQAKEFFNEISLIYKDEPGIIYEICNEPNGDTTWEDIRRYADEVIPIIRNNSPNAVILVGTPNYSSDIWTAAKAPLSYDNIMYTLHFYAEYYESDGNELSDYVLPENFPVFVSEWGSGNTESAEEEALLLSYCEQFADFMKEKKISWAAWSLSNADEGYSMIRPDSKKLSNWDADALTNYGRFIFDRLGDNTK